ncbi:hypothetical protein GCM10010517_61130 [Streptosporangium fragile]|uniref:Uncharacterized protein n=1 Tax=Streptosporangium fragile TaxID=46186 RepID=A0ABN3W5Y4_9ACTN
MAGSARLLPGEGTVPGEGTAAEGAAPRGTVPARGSRKGAPGGSGGFGGLVSVGVRLQGEGRSQVSVRR